MNNTLEKDVIILSGKPLYRDDLGDFCIDVDTISLHKPRLVMDWNHNEDEVVGYIENIHTSVQGQLVGHATIQSVLPGDRADEVIARIQAGCPYELSPTVILDEADSEVISDSAETTYTKYYNVPLRGVSFCLFGTDPDTKTLSLTNNKENKMRKRTKKLGIENPAEIIEEVVDAIESIEEAPVDAIETTEPEQDNPYTACPELEQYIADYGYDLGVELFRRFGADFESAEKYDYQQLRMKRLAENEEEKKDAEIPAETIAEIAEETGIEPEVVAEIVAEEVAEKDDEKQLKCRKLSVSMLKMASKVAKLTQQVRTLSARGAQPVSAGAVSRPDNRSAIQRYADKITKK